MRSFYFTILVLLFLSCSNNVETESEINQSFKINLNLNENPNGQEIKKITGELSRTGESVVFDFDIDPDNSLANAELHQIKTGLWILSVSAFKDFDGDTLLYSGTASVQIRKDQTELVDIYINDDSGNLIVNINWQDSQFYLAETEHFIFKIPLDYFDERVIIEVKENNPYSTVKLYADRIWWGDGIGSSYGYGDIYYETQSVLSTSYEIHLKRKNLPDLTLDQVSMIDSAIGIYDDNDFPLEFVYFDYGLHADSKLSAERKTKRLEKLRLKAN